MLKFVTRLVFSIFFFFVETIIAIVVHTFFSHQFKKITDWVVKYRRITFLLIIPLLLLSNFGMTFLFSRSQSFSPPRSVTRQETFPAGKLTLPSEGMKEEEYKYNFPLTGKGPEKVFERQPVIPEKKKEEKVGSSALKGDVADNTLR